MDADDLRDWYEERAAIYEYDAGLDRATAERLAGRDAEGMRREQESAPAGE